MQAPQIALAAVWIGWWMSWLAAAAWSDRAVARPPARHQIVYRLCAMAGVVLLFGLYRHDFQSEIIVWRTPQPLAWLLVAAAAAGFAFTWWARIHLGRLWSTSVTRKAGHHVVDSGPYGIVRHPIYSGITIAATATAVARGTVAGWGGMVVMTLGWYLKARLEEGFLREELGAAAYDQYARRVPMLIPFLR